MKYLEWDKKIINEVDDIEKLYDLGYVFTRIDKGVMHQTRSARINLSKFELSSENRRMIKKTDGLNLSVDHIPYQKYEWSIGKLAKDFYDKKFGEKIFSVFKIKEMLETQKSNFNRLFIYKKDNEILGYSICYVNNNIMHYSYPFYNIDRAPKDMGMGMMIRAIQYAKDNKLKYIYLGSLQRPADTYKLQFDGIEWFDGKLWSTDLNIVKDILNSK